jgi:hypothetical protein
MMDVVVSIVAVATAALAVWLLPEVGGPIDRFAGVVVGGLLAMGIYLLLQRARGSRELTEFAGSLRGESRAAA